MQYIGQTTFNRIVAHAVLYFKVYLVICINEQLDNEVSALYMIAIITTPHNVY